MKVVSRSLLASVALNVTLAALSGCASSVPLKVAEAPLARGDEFIFLNSLHCNRDQTVAAMGFLGDPTWPKGKGVALHSDDQGLTWRMVDLGAGADSVSVSLVALPAKDQQSEEPLYASGYLIGGLSLSFDRRPGPWWMSQDGGRSWVQAPDLYPLPVSNVTSLLIGPGALPAPLRPIVVADERGTLLTIRGGTDSMGSTSAGKPSADTLLRSTDAGKTWELSPSHNILTLTSLLTNGRGHAAAAGLPEEGKPGMVFWSEDAGANWTLAGFANPSEVTTIWLSGDPDHTLIAHSGQMIYRSEDGGRAWQGPLRLKEESFITAMTGDGKGRLVALMASGAAMVSDDWGKTWRRRDTGIRMPPSQGAIKSDSSLISTGNGILIGYFRGGRFTRSTDWGETWHTVDSQLPDKSFGLRVSCTDGRGLIVVGGDWGMLTRSTDWGATWQRARMADRP
jgi:photosystem II stability/assembly factor-like uncharacterized protein